MRILTTSTFEDYAANTLLRSPSSSNSASTSTCSSVAGVVV